MFTDDDTDTGNGTQQVNPTDTESDSTPTEEENDDSEANEEPSEEEEINPEDTEDADTEDADDDSFEPKNADISLTDQTDAEQLVIDRVETTMAVQLEIVDEQNSALAPTVLIDGDEILEEYAIQYIDPLEKQQDIRMQLVHEDAGIVADSTATVYPRLVELTQGEVLFINAQPASGFNYPYFAYIPSEIGSSGSVFVEPNNTGSSTDDFQEHRIRAESRLDPNSWRRQIPEYLGLPFLVPVFPRPRNEPRDWRHYVHALDAETMSIDDGPLERVDRQLLAMVDHFRESLAVSIGYDAAADFHLNGFSASGNFVNRFTALHPERVRAVTAGGVNGTLLLPREEAEGGSLPYPIGVANISEVTGTEFDKAAWADVPQFIYMGDADTNDTIPYDDAWNKRLREIALDVYGEDIHAERIPFCKSIYKDVGANAQIHVYQNVGHSIPRWVRRDLYQFHRKHLQRNADFDPIRVRDAPALEVGFAEQPRGGETEITVHISVPEYYKIGDKFSDGSVSLMLDTGDKIEWSDRIGLRGNGHVTPRELPVDETRTFDVERPLESGEQLTIGIMDGQIITATSITVD